MTEISAFSSRKSGFNENHSAENNNRHGSTHQRRPVLESGPVKCTVQSGPESENSLVRRPNSAWIPCDSCTNNNCSITVYFCEDIPVTTKALAREIVKKSQIQKTSGTGINEPARSDYHVVPGQFGDP